MKNKCSLCQFFNNDPGWLETSLPGLNILSSAYACVRADAGVCLLHEIFTPPWRYCKYFVAEKGEKPSPPH